jgi:RND superfamily putative drug exporter
VSLGKITDLVCTPRGKWITLLVWIIAAAIITPLTPNLASVRSSEGSLFIPRDAESVAANDLQSERYPGSGTPAIIVIRNESGLTDANMEDARRISDFLTSGEAGDNIPSVVSVYTVPQAAAELISPDNTTMTIVATITGNPNEEEFTDTVDRIRKETAAIDGADLEVKVSGPAGLIVDLVKVFAGIDGFLLAVTAGLVLVLLVLIYRSPVVALVPLISVGWVFSMADSLAAWMATVVGFSVDGQSTGIMTVLLFGAGTDYCLFISSRYREELTRVEDKHEAMRRTLRGVGEAILSAGSTILLATLILLLAVLPAYRSLAPVLAIAVGLMMIAAITLVPAILTILGRGSFWPFRPKYVENASPDEQESKIWSWMADHVLKRPVAVLIVTLAGLLIMTGGLVWYDPSYDSLDSLPPDTESVEGFELLRAGFPAGELAPTDVFLVFPDGQPVFTPESLAAIDAVSTELAAKNGVSSASSPSQPFGSDAPVGLDVVTGALELVPPEALQPSEGTGGPPPGVEEIDPESPEGQAYGILASAARFVSADQQVARIELILDENPYGSAALDMVPDLRETARDAAATHGLETDQVLVGGATAESYDTRAGNTRDILVVLPLVLLSIAIVLGLLLRSIIAPLYLSLTIVITYFATLGLAVFCFRFIFGQEVIGYTVPFYLFVFLNALGVDYNIYLMARVREEAKEHELKEATRRALVRTGGVITSAGLILAGTFSALMTLPLMDLFQLGFAVAIGVLMDTFITRTVIVPSIVTLLGRWNWWPLPGPRQG